MGCQAPEPGVHPAPIAVLTVAHDPLCLGRSGVQNPWGLIRKDAGAANFWRKQPTDSQGNVADCFCLKPQTLLASEQAISSVGKLQIGPSLRRLTVSG